LAPGVRALVYDVWVTGPRLVELVERTDEIPGAWYWTCRVCGGSRDCRCERWLCIDLEAHDLAAKDYIFSAGVLVAQD
jgi:hypothetical protein